jgi:hypothetical protein
MLSVGDWDGCVPFTYRPPSPGVPVEGSAVEEREFLALVSAPVELSTCSYAGGFRLIEARKDLKNLDVLEDCSVVYEGGAVDVMEPSRVGYMIVEERWQG